MNGSEQPECPRTNLETLLLLLDSRRTEAHLAELTGLLRSHAPGLDDVGSYCRFDPSGYTRTIVSESPRYRLLVLCWLPGQISPIHDHAGSACAVLVANGTATETRFKLTPEGLARPTKTLVYGPGAVFGGRDADIHALGCREGDVPLITVHIYSPPLLKMNFYEPQTPAAA